MQFPDFTSALAALYRANGQSLQLNAGASEAAIAQAEAELGFAICPALKSAWLHADGGERWQTVFARTGYLTGYDFLSLREAMKQWRGMKARAPRYAGYVQPSMRDARLRDGWFQQGWLPFAGFSAPTMMLLVDHTPAAGGTPGQIIAFTHDPDAMTLVGPDFSTLLRDSLAQIEAEPDDLLPE